MRKSYYCVVNRCFGVICDAGIVVVVIGALSICTLYVYDNGVLFISLAIVSFI